MGNSICPSDIDLGQLAVKLVAWHKADEYCSFVESATAIVCAVFFFVRYRSLHKPAFVLFMWLLFIVSQVAFCIITILLRVQGEAKSTGDVEKSDRIRPYLSESLCLYQVTLMGGHWVFAIKYAEVVLKLPLIVFPEMPENANIEAKLNKIQCVVWTLNGLFIALVVTYTIID